MDDNTTKQISLKWLIYRLLRAWKLNIIVAVLVGIIFCSINVTINFIKIGDEELMSNERLDFEREQTSWLAAREGLQLQLDNLEKEKANQLEYNEKSVLMKIDPLRKNVASFELYIDDVYRSEESADISSRILRAYSGSIFSENMYSQISEGLNYSIGRRYLNEILDVFVDAENDMMSVSVLHINAEKCQQLLSLIKLGINSRYTDVCQEIAPHGIIITNEVAYETVDTELDDIQKENTRHITDIEMELQQVNAQLRSSEREKTPEFAYSAPVLIKSGAKWFLIGALGSAVMFALASAMLILLSDKLLEAEEISSRFGLRIIGQLPSTDSKRGKLRKSRAISRLYGIGQRQQDYESLAKMIGVSIRLEMLAQTKDGSKKTVAFTGSCSPSQISKAVLSMGLEESEIVLAPNVLTSAAAIDKVAASDYVVLIEAQDSSALEDIKRELEALAAWEKTIIGAVVINVDSIK